MSGGKRFLYITVDDARSQLTVTHAIFSSVLCNNHQHNLSCAVIKYAVDYYTSIAVVRWQSQLRANGAAITPDVC